MAGPTSISRKDFVTGWETWDKYPDGCYVSCEETRFYCCLLWGFRHDPTEQHMGSQDMTSHVLLICRNSD